MFCLLYRLRTGDVKCKLSLDEIQEFTDQVMQLACKIPEITDMKDLMSNVQEFQTTAVKLISEEKPSLDDVVKCLDLGSSLPVELPELPQIKQVSRDVPKDQRKLKPIFIS